MNKLIPLSLAVVGLSLLPFAANAKHEREHDRYEHRHEHHHEHKKHSKKHHKKYYKKHHKSAYYKKLPPGLYKKVGYGHGLPPGWYKKYHRGDRLDRDIYRHGKILKPVDRDGRITIEVDDTVIHMVHDTREILSILSRYQ